MNHGTEQKGAIAWMARNGVAANILMIILVLGGLVLLFSGKIKQEFFPEAVIDTVFITVPYPGASPEEVEQGILLAVEESVRGIDGVKEVGGIAYEGMASVEVEVLSGHDVNKVMDDVRNAVSRVRTLPLDAEKPNIGTYAIQPPVLDVVISADVEPSVLREITERVRDRLLLEDDITLIELNNARGMEIGIEIPQNRLREYGLSLSDVANIIARSSVELPGGGLKTSAGEILVRVNDRRDIGREFARIPIVTTPDGTRVLLEDIADIRDGFDESDRDSFFNGKPALSLTVKRVGEETPITVDRAVKRALEELEATLPVGVELSISNNSADAFRGRMSLLAKNGALGLVLVFVMLGVFLELRLAFWVMLGIPISFLGTFLFMPALDVSLNMVSMFAFLISLGIVVDDAIVVGENIYHNHQDGMPFLKAATHGARDICVPVTFSILTNVVAFLPLYFVPGVWGKFFRVIPMVVCTIFIISLVEALFILPAHLAHQKDKPKGGFLHARQQAFSRGFTNFVKNVYGPFLAKTMRARYLTLSVGIAILIITLGYVKSGRIGFEPFPSVESDIATCSYSLPYGAPVEKTMKVHDRLIAAGHETIAEIEEEYGETQLKNVLSFVGNGGGHAGRVRFEMTDPDTRPLSTQQFIDRWRENAGAIGGLQFIQFTDNNGGPGGGGSALTVELSHRDMGVLETATEELAEALSAYPMIRDIDSGFTPGKPQIDFAINANGRSLGLTSSEIARQVRDSYYGAEAIRQQRGRDEVKIKVRLPEAERDTLFSLEEMILRTPDGKEVPLREIADIKKGRAYTAINRRDGRRVINFSADVKPRDQTARILSVLREEILPTLIQKHAGLSYSFEGRQAEQRESLSGLFTGLRAALLLIYFLLAIPFKSYFQPLIIMISIPFGIVGAVIGHVLLGYSLSMIGLFGVVALSGVVVNDSLVFIDFANRKRRDGASLRDAVVAAGVQRFRPIVLTTLTTFFGLMPMIFETSLQARFLIPMAISLGFGILFATGITLLLIPSLIMILEDIGTGAKSFFRWLFNHDE